jgi:hypothetical protein
MLLLLYQGTTSARRWQRGVKKGRTMLPQAVGIRRIRLCRAAADNPTRRPARPRRPTFSLPTRSLPLRLIFISCQEAHLFTKVTLTHNTPLTTQ